MLSYNRISLVLAYLKAILIYKIDDPVGRRSDLGLHLDEELFYKDLYVPHPKLETKCLDLITHYAFPVVLSGKQGLGKTSVLEKVLRTVENDDALQTTVVRIRCVAADRRFFTDLEGVKEYFQIAFRSKIAKLQASIFELLADTYRDEERFGFIDRSTDPALQLFNSVLFEMYDAKPQSGRSMPFYEWVVWSLEQREPDVKEEVAKFWKTASLATQVSLLAMRLGLEHRILFSVDNVENLLDLSFIRNAFSLLMRCQGEIGEHGRLIVATRPASHQMSIENRDRIYGDEGRNLFDPIDFSEYLEPLVVSANDVPEVSDVVLTEEPGGALLSRTVSRYIDLLERRIAMLLRELPAEEEIKAIFEVIESFFNRGRECTHIIAGLSNHSCRTVLLTVVNYLEQVLEDPEFLKSLFGVEVQQDGHNQEIPGFGSNSKLIHDPLPNAALLNGFLFYAGRKAADIPGLIRSRLDMTAILDRYKATNRVPYEMLSSFYILKCLNGCDIACFAEDAAAEELIHRMSVNELVMRLAPFGFDRDMVYSRCTTLCEADAWDQTILAYTTTDQNPKWREATGKDIVELESRGWMMANILPFRFHYWRGDLSRRYLDREIWSPHGLTEEQIRLTTGALIDWSEMELKLVGDAARVLDSKDEVIKSYAEITHLNRKTPWVFLGIAASFAGHFRSLSNRIGARLQDEHSVLAARAAERSCTALLDSLTRLAHRVGGNELSPRWSIYRQSEIAELEAQLN